MFAGPDAGWPKKKVILWWLSRYNRFVRRRGLPKSLAVHLERPPQRSRIMAAVKSKNTSPELVVRRLVHSLGFRYRLHVPSLPGAPDLVFPRLKKIILIHGCFWHMHSCGACRIPAIRRKYWLAKIQRNAARDRKNIRALRRLGWSVMVLWECQTKRAHRPRLQPRLLRFLTGD
jgi:DNA mismatch endonuclease (patch repair protein)